MPPDHADPLSGARLSNSCAPARYLLPVTNWFNDMPIGFSHPVWLWLLLVLPLFFWIERRSLVLLTTSRRTLALVVRTVVFVLLVLALAGLRIERQSDRLTVLFAIDKSESVLDSEITRALEQINTAAATKRNKDSAGLIVFGDEALVERSPAEAFRVEKLESAPSRGYTDLSKAIRLAVGLFPEGSQRRLVVFTDGNENLGNAISEANIASANDIPIDIIPLKSATGEEVLVEGVGVPEKVDKKKPFDVKITVRSSVAGTAKLRLYKDKNFIGENEVQLTEGKNIFLFPQVEENPGFHTYEAMIDTLQDTVRDNNQAGAYTVVYGEPKVLLVGAPEDTQFLKEAMQIENIPADIAELPPNSAAEAENYDAIFLCNVSAERLSDAQLKLLNGYTGELGGGLAMVGGESSYGIGGYRNTPVEEALPVSMEIKNKKNFPSLGLMILIDKSGSMSGTLNGGKTKLELAVEASVAAANLLTERDHIGVIGFDSAAKWDCPFVPAKDKKRIEDNIRSLRPGGGTDAIPAFNEAIRVFSNAKLQLKHIIFVSDGMVAPGDYDRIMRDLNNLGVTVTTVGVGDDADKAFMEKVAGATGGRPYFTSDPSNVPRIFTKETVMAQRSYLIEESFTPEVYQQNEITKGIGAMPSLLGYVATEEKERSEVLLKTHKGDALMAVWRYRSGKSLAWTSDAKDRWAAQWLGWGEFKKFWGQSARWVMRNRRESDLHPHITVENGVGRITVDAVSDKGEFRNFMTLEAAVMTPTFDIKRLQLRQTAAGHYEAEFDAKQVGTYLTSVSGDQVEPAVAGASVSYPPEYQSLKPNHLLMSQVASITGGKVDPPVTDFFRRDNQRVQNVQDLWYHLLWIALVLFLYDIAVRRIFLDEEQRAQIAAFIKKLVPSAPQRATVEAVTGTLGALKARHTELREKQTVEPILPSAALNAVRVDGLERKVVASEAPVKPLRAEPTPQPASKPADATPAAQPQEATYTSRLLEARRKAQKKTTQQD